MYGDEILHEVCQIYGAQLAGNKQGVHDLAVYTELYVYGIIDNDIINLVIHHASLCKSYAHYCDLIGNFLKL